MLKRSAGVAAAAAALALVSSPAQPPVAESPGRLWVRLVDEQGRPLAARVYATGPDGAPLIPAASIARQSRSREFYFHADGGFQLLSPPGRVVIEAVKGFEYTPARAQATVVSDRTTAVTMVVRRFVDMPSSGWHSGDVHMHPNHVPGAAYINMHDVLALAKGEDIHVSNLLAGSVGVLAHVFDTEHFNDGKPDPVSTPEHILVVQQEVRNTSAMYGHIALLGISRLVYPFYTGQPRSPHWEDYPALYHAAKAAREQGGAVSYLHPANKPEIPVGDHLAREFPVDLALGVVDALDVLSNMDEEGSSWMYYRVLNSGLKCAVSAGTDSQMDQRRHALPGGSKVYVKTPAPLTYAGWIEGYKAGRSFVSNGPLLWLEVDGKEPGAEIALDAPRAVRAVARTRSLVPVSALELVVNGDVVARKDVPDNGAAVELAHEVTISRSSWIAARVHGPGNRLVMNDSRAFAHTSPVYCYVSKQKIAFREDAKTVVAWIDRVLQDVRSSPRFATPARRQEVIALFEKGKAYYENVVRDGQ
jgi:hypothetical protein